MSGYCGRLENAVNQDRTRARAGLTRLISDSAGHVTGRLVVGGEKSWFSTFRVVSDRFGPRAIKLRNGRYLSPDVLCAWVFQFTTNDGRGEVVSFGNISCY